MQWVTKTQIEQLLAELGLTWTAKRLTFDRIDFAASERNQARTQTPVNPSKIADYADVMKQLDAVFFYCVSLEYETPTDKGFTDMLLDGNTRGRAAKLARLEYIMVYAVKDTGKIASDLLPRLLNSLEGERTTDEDMFLHVCVMVNDYEMSVKKACALLKVKPDPMEDKMRILKNRLAIHDAGGAEKGVNDSTIKAIAPIKNMPVQVALTNLISSLKLKGEALDELIKRVREKNNEAEMLAIIKSYNTQFGGSTPSFNKKGRSAQVLFMQIGKKFLDLVKGKTSLAQFGITAHSDRAKAKQLLADLKNSLRSIK